MNDLPEINFDGKRVKPKNGIYRCPYHCSNPNYPTRKWKTEKGFQKHMNECPNSPSALKKRNDREIEKKIQFDKLLEEFNKMKEEFLPNIPLKIGQKVFYVRKILVKPTHVQRGNRLVKVRYEEVYDYDAREDVIKSIDGNFDGYLPKDLEQMKNYILINNNIPLNTLCSSMVEAKEKVKEHLKAQKEYLDFSSFCR